MRVCLISSGPSGERILAHLTVQARLFRERGDEVQLIVPGTSHAVPQDLTDLVINPERAMPRCDVYVYHDAGDYPPAPALSQHESGLVLIHDHNVPPPHRVAYAGDGGLLLAHYADLTLVDNTARYEQLLDDYGLARERVRLLPGIDDESAYRAALVELVDRAMADDWPAATVPTVSPPRQKSVSSGPATARSSLMLAQRQADVMLRSYTVRSRIPILGSLVAWVRRNLTSHLREPYLDPTLERQVAFNRTVVAWMEQVQARLEALESDPGRRPASPGDAERNDRSDKTW